MTKTYAIAAALICAAAASWSATEVLVEDEPTVIEISVTQDKLAECRETLRNVAQAPTVHDNGTPMLFDYSEDLPQVRCVVEA